MGSQRLDRKTGQAVLLPEKKCPHGLMQDDRGNTACEQCFDDRNTESYLLGISVGYEEVSGWLRGLSGQRFVEGKDSEAHALRRLADDVAKQQAEKRKKFEEAKKERESQVAA